MEYISTKEAAAKWGISTSRITLLANEGRIPGAQRIGRSWLIPVNAAKPPERKPNRSGSAAKIQKETNDFSFPLYLFRPDWSSAKEAQLSEQQQSLLLAEKTVMECRFSDAYPMLEAILLAPDDVYTEAACLFNAGICCVSLNKPDTFSKIFLRFKMLLAKDFPHRNDLAIMLDILKSYVETIGAFANNAAFNPDIHDQCLPLACLKFGYVSISKEAIKPGAADAALLEINLRFLQNTSAVIAIEMMHIYLLGIYYLRHDMAAAEKHAKAAVQIAFKSKLYFPLVTYYRYFASILSPIIAQYPREFQDLCLELASQYKKNFTAFLTSISEDNVISKLSDSDYPYIYAVLTGQSNPHIAEQFNVHPQTVQNRLSRLCKKLGVNSKKELRNYLRSYM